MPKRIAWTLWLPVLLAAILMPLSSIATLLIAWAGIGRR